MLKISYAGCFGLTSAISSQFSIEVCTAFKYCEKFTKNPFWKGSRSFKVIDVVKSKKPVTSACYDKQHVCTYLRRFHIIRANNGKMTSFLGVPLFHALVRGESLPCTQWHKIFCHDKLETLRQPTVKIS